MGEGPLAQGAFVPGFSFVGATATGGMSLLAGTGRQCRPLGLFSLLSSTLAWWCSAERIPCQPVMCSTVPHGKARGPTVWGSVGNNNHWSDVR